jgi:hypothetical protein
MTDQPTSGHDDRQHGEQPASYSQPHGTGSTTPGYGSQPDYGQAHDEGYGKGAPGSGQPGGPYGTPYGNQGQHYPVPGHAGSSYDAYGHASEQYPAPGLLRPGYNAYGQPGYYGAPAQPKTLSIASLCCGIAALVGFGFFLLPQIAAVILGHMALSREPAGRGLAVAGLVLGYVGVALTVLVIVLLAVLFSSARYSGYSA